MPKPTEDGQRVWDNLEPTFKDTINQFHLRTLSRGPLTVEDFTCANCCIVARCELAYDLYNLDGDCLKEK